MTESIRRGQLRQGQTETIEMSIGTYETTLNLQLWKAYADEIEISIETPSGERLPTLSEKSVHRDIVRGRRIC